MIENHVSVDELRQMLSYDPGSGLLTRASNPTENVGYVTQRGYVLVRVGGGRQVLAHRIAWALHHGAWPLMPIDHINGIKTDNRIANLRLCTFSQNNANRAVTKRSRSGLKGVHWCNTKRAWIAQIQVNGRGKTIGRFDTAEKAAAAYAEKAREFFGEFANDQSQSWG